MNINVIEVNYDLRKPGRNYQPLYDYLKSYSSWCRPLDSLWFVRATKTAQQVRDDLLRLIDANDKVLCVNVTDDAMAWHGLPSDVSDWLRTQTSRWAA